MDLLRDHIPKKSLELHKVLASELNTDLAPLLSHMGLTHFVYTRFQSGRKYMLLVNVHDDLEKFFTQNIDRHFDKQDFSIIPQGRYHVFWPYAPNNPMLNCLKEWNIWNGFTILDRDEFAVEGFHFATTVNNNGILDLYMNQRALLDNFIVFFHQKLNKLLFKHNDLPTWDYPSGFQLDLSKKKTVVKIYDKIKNSIALKKYHISYNGETSTLTRRHLDILNALSNGKTDKEIAQIYKLSPRTIESYILNIRYKYNLSTRKDLMDLWKANPLLSSLYL